MFSGCSTTIKTGEVEPIEVLLRNDYGQPLLGSNFVHIQIRRVSDGFYFDWATNTFRNSGTDLQLLQRLTEISPTLEPGAYHLNTGTHQKGFNTAAVTNPTINDIYEVTILNTGTETIPGLPIGFEIKVGFFIDQISNMSPQVANAVWDAMQADHTLAGSFGDLLRRIVALQKENYVIDGLQYNAQGLMLHGRIRLFNTRAQAMLATKDGNSEGEFATYSFTSAPQTGNPERADFIHSVRET